MRFTILDCYTDEPSGLGVPPYLITYPRYIAGAILKYNRDNIKGNNESNNKENNINQNIDDTQHDYFYLTIDDIRLHKFYNGKIKNTATTNIRIANLSKNYPNIQKILDSTDILIVVGGVQTPGKYLSALPGTLAEISMFIKDLKCLKVLTGPSAMAGEGLFGGRLATQQNTAMLKYGFGLVIPNLEYKFDLLMANNFSEDVQATNMYKFIREQAILGAEIVKQHPQYSEFMIVDVETARGCNAATCSFCTEPVKNAFMLRPIQDVVDECIALARNGIKNIRLGKQADFFSRSPQQIEQMLKAIVDNCKPEILHIDNVNPRFVTEEKTKLVVEYCTPGNVAAFGVESFDPKVIALNKLNADADSTLNAAKIINKYGQVRGSNGMPKFLPGINIIFGLEGESKETQQYNMVNLKHMLDNNIQLRRINIRQVVVFEGTQMAAVGSKFIKKNKKRYWSWRNQIRQEIDLPMLRKIVPNGTIMTGLRTEIHDGNTTFARQIGSYPLCVGIKQKLLLNEWVDIKVVGHMLRSVTGEIVKS
ncbi:TPA: radical SAM protein [Candidatus Woesearchaeota archaeon]|nr:radical SAM protein [Candidatus Woesearchaeota archaeon]